MARSWKVWALTAFVIGAAGTARAQSWEEACNQTLDDMSAPISHPTNFEDPRPYTEIRPIYIHHKIDSQFATGGGDVNVYALQLRYAVNDRLAIIATKDGYADVKLDDVFDDRGGWANVAAGAKYAIYRDDKMRQIVSLGLRYEAPVGEEKIFQTQGGGMWNPFLSAGVGIGPVNVMTGTGFRLATDSKDSSFFDFEVHADTKIGMVHPLLELSVINVLDAGTRIGIPDEGEDFFNFGASAADGSTLVSGTIGARVDLAKDWEGLKQISWGGGYQFPISDGNGSHILDYRVTTDLIFRF